VSASIQSGQLPTMLRTLRIGLDDTLHIRRTVHLAAAKIEDLQDQVARLAAELHQATTTRGIQRKPGRISRAH
jgi:hypothetical protein